MAYFKKLLESSDSQYERDPWYRSKDGNIEVTNQYMTFLPSNFPKISEYNLDIHRCENLKSLKNCSHHVKGEFKLLNNPRLESLEGFPKIIEDDFEIVDSVKAYHDLWRIGFSTIKGNIFIWDNSELGDVCRKYKNCGKDRILKFQNEVGDILDLI